MGQSQLIRRFVTNDKLNFLTAKERKQTYKTGSLPHYINIHHRRFKSCGGTNREPNLLPLRKDHHRAIHKLDIQLREYHKLIGVPLVINDKYFDFIIRSALTNKDKKYKACIIETLDNIINKPKMTIIDKHYGAVR